MSGALKYLSRYGLGELLQQLVGQGFSVIGPQAVQGTILYTRIDSVEELPWGCRDRQDAGSYRLKRSDEPRAFAWANGPQALKPLFFAPEERLWQVTRGSVGLAFTETLPEVEPQAIIGVRACDLAALAIHDQHFLHGVEADPHYAQRRRSTFIVAVNCSHPAATCFCAATGDGPGAESGFDLLLDELDGGYLVEAGSKAGSELLQSLSLEAATEAQCAQASEQRSHAAKQQRKLPQQNLSGKLAAKSDSPHWKQIAERCLACGNCTAVCPTCFCHSEHDHPQLDGSSSEHVRLWDSCFSADHSMLHGTPVRAETAHRYRQWLSHKFDHWHQQYGRSGCVGCGRCITWCPVGIDVTEALQTLCGGEP